LALTDVTRLVTGRILQSLTLHQAANYQCDFLRVRGLTQGQALQNPPVA
jgi:hypothetical protein